MWDSLPPDADKQVSGDSKTYRWTANPTIFSHPTTLRSDYGWQLSGHRGVGTRMASTMDTDDEDDIDDFSIYSQDNDSSSEEGSSNFSCSANKGTNSVDAQRSVVVGDVSVPSSFHSPIPASTVRPIEETYRNKIESYEKEIIELKEEVSSLRKKLRQAKWEKRVL